MAIKFVNVEPTAEKPEAAPPTQPGEDAAPQGEVAARPRTDEPRPAPRGRTRKAPDAPRPATPDGDEAADASRDGARSPSDPAALPGLEGQRPKPRRRARPYWGFG